MKQISRRHFMKTSGSSLTAGVLSSFGVIPSYASRTEPMRLEAFSSEYPNAYILLDENLPSLVSRSEVPAWTTTATVFVEDTYATTENGRVIVNSRLLSKEEVDAIGEKNFPSMGNSSNLTREASSTRGKLTIRLDGTYTDNGTRVTCNASAIATWDNVPLIGLSENIPAVGNDFCGMLWGGGFNLSSQQIELTTIGDNALTYYQAASIPNQGRVWEFDEYNNYDYLKRGTFTVNLYKNNKTGGGNTTSVAYQYIHTYQTTENTGYSIGFTDLSFSLSNISKQWSIALTLTGIPY